MRAAGSLGAFGQAAKARRSSSEGGYATIH